MKKLSIFFFASAFFLTACNLQPPQDTSSGSQIESLEAGLDQRPGDANVSLYVNSSDDVANKIIKAFPTAKVTYISPNRIQTVALDYSWEEATKIAAFLAENATDGYVSGEKTMFGLSQEEEDALKAKDKIRLVVTLIPISLLGQ